MRLQDFYNSRRGACLLVGNGPNLELTPPELFNLPAFGMNTIHKREGWKPDYYIAVDNRVMREFGAEISTVYADIPKFVTTDLDMWSGENFYYFNHSARPMQREPYDENSMIDPGVTYSNVMHAAMQIAAWMGFDALLIIGMQHDPATWRDHFWGCDEAMPGRPPIERWMSDYREIVATIGAKVINISANTHVPSEIIPREDWRKYAKN